MNSHAAFFYICHAYVCHAYVCHVFRLVLPAAYFHAVRQIVVCVTQGDCVGFSADCDGVGCEFLEMLFRKG